MTAQDNLISYIQSLSIKDEEFKNLKVLIHDYLEPKTEKNNKEFPLEGFREDVFNQDTKKKGKKVNKKNNTGKTLSNKHNGPIRINPNNPKKVNCKSWTLYESYKKAESFEQFKELGGENKHYNYDLKKGLIIELTEEHLKLLAEDPGYNFFKKDTSEEKSSSKDQTSNKKSSSKSVKKESEGMSSKVDKEETEEVFSEINNQETETEEMTSEMNKQETKTEEMSSEKKKKN